jgi:ribosomal protein L11 methylase PrmA
MPSGFAREAGSFRDPAGYVFRSNGRILRTVTTRAKADYEFVRDSGCLAQLIERGWVVGTVETDPQPQFAVEKTICYVLEHERVPWISFPYEWGFSALKAAAILHLEVQLLALENDIVLSDASAYNVQFIGSKPIFIDVLSFRRRRDGELWTGQRQFIEQFLNPLLLRALAGVPHNPWYRGSLEGIESQHLNRVIPLWRKFGWKILTNVTLPSMIQRSARKRSTENIQKLKEKHLSKTGYRALLVSMRDWIAMMRPKESGETVWENYETNRTYQSIEAVKKRDFISQFVQATKPKMVWDLGCNTGEFSEAALAAGAGYVVGFDIDHGALDKAFARSRDSGLALQVVHQDAANPTPSQGWLMRERGSIIARGTPDAIFALAFEHHLAIGKNIPLDQVVCWLTSLAPTGVIEFVQKSDPTVQRMLAAREDIFDDYNEENFRASLESCADITHEQRITDDNRVLFGFKVRSQK